MTTSTATALRPLPDDRRLGTARTAAEQAAEQALRRVSRWAGRDVWYAPVHGGLSNSNWRVLVDGADKRYFMKLPGAGTEAYIDRGLANEAAGRAGELGIGPEVVLFDPETGVEVIEFLGDHRACTNGDFKRPEVPLQVIDLYRALHASGPLSTTKTALDMVDEHLDQVRELGVVLPPGTQALLAEYAAAKQALLASGLDLVACHNDPMPGNFLIADRPPLKIIDFEYASNNERAYELGLLLAEMFYGEEQSLELVEAYYGATRWPVVSRVQVCVALADVKWGLWGCVNSRLNSSWDFDYYKYGAWKLARAASRTSDPRWPFWLRSL